MRQYLAAALVIGLILMSFGGLPGGAEDPDNPEGPGGSGESQRIGAYQRVVDSDDLTLEHVEHLTNGIRVEGPSLTDTLRVDTGFLAAEVGPGWGASKAFSFNGDEIVVPGRSVEFKPLDLDSDPVFTMGSRDQIEFQERPMWVSVDQAEQGGQITLDLEDGDASGQQVYISREWLWGRGIQWFNATHEDGTLLPVTDLAGGVLVDVHHFSEVYINPDGLDVKKVVGGVKIANQGETRWSWQESVLEVDVDYNPEQDYTVLIPADWTDLHIRPHTFKVYSSGQLVDNPDTGLQVCCGGGGGSQNYYSVKFSTSGLSVRIEVVGEHIPVYTMQDGDLAPHWGEKRWDEDASVLEVDVGEQSSDYEVWVDKDWVDLNIDNPALEDYLWMEKWHDGSPSLPASTYHVVKLTADNTPMTVVFRPFALDGALLYSQGSPNTVLFDRPFQGAFIKGDDFLTIQHDNGPTGAFERIRFNTSLVDELDIINPQYWDGSYIFLLEPSEEGYLTAWMDLSNLAGELSEQTVVLEQLEDSDPVPFSGSIIWSDNITLRVIIDYSAYYDEVLVSKDWIESIAGTTELNISHEYEISTIEGESFFSHTDCCPSLDIDEIVFSLQMIPDEVPAVPADVLPHIVFGNNQILWGADGECDDGNSDSFVYLGHVNSKGKGTKTGSQYEIGVTACFRTFSQADGTEWADVYYKMSKHNKDGKHLSHLLGSNCLGGQRSACIQVLTAGADEAILKDHDPSTGSVDDCDDTEFELNVPIDGVDFSMAWTADLCGTSWNRQVADSKEGRWIVRKAPWGGGDDHSTLRFDFGVVDRTPIVEANFESVIQINTLTRFHSCGGVACPPYYRGAQEFTVTATKSSIDGEEEFNNHVGNDQLLLGASSYNYTELLKVVQASDQDEATMLATTLLGAKLRETSGVIAPTIIQNAMIEADLILSNYESQGKLPWDNWTPQNGDDQTMIQLRETLLGDFKEELLVP